MTGHGPPADQHSASYLMMSGVGHGARRGQLRWGFVAPDDAPGRPGCDATMSAASDRHAVAGRDTRVRNVVRPHDVSSKVRRYAAIRARVASGSFERTSSQPLTTGDSSVVSSGQQLVQRGFPAVVSPLSASLIDDGHCVANRCRSRFPQADAFGVSAKMAGFIPAAGDGSRPAPPGANSSGRRSPGGDGLRSLAVQRLVQCKAARRRKPRVGQDLGRSTATRSSDRGSVCDAALCANVMPPWIRNIIVTSNRRCTD